MIEGKIIANANPIGIYGYDMLKDDTRTTTYNKK